MSLHTVFLDRPRWTRAASWSSSPVAKYDVSCASSGTTSRDSSDGRGIGSTEGMGICRSYAPDGRCISLLKVLLTNWCTHDCLYCVKRVRPKARTFP